MKDRKAGDRVLRAGVIYTRIGDTNVPLRESAPEDMIELMWRERFGLGMSPLQRALRLLTDRNAWTHVGGDEYLYHEHFPEFVLQKGEDLNEDFEEPWTRRFPDKKAWSFQIELRYGGTVLRKFAMVRCDGGRYTVPIPDRVGKAVYPERQLDRVACGGAYDPVQAAGAGAAGVRSQVD